MKTEPLIRAQYCAEINSVQVSPKDFAEENVVHYSIPAIQETGGPIIEVASTIESNKLLLEGGEVLVSRLNPHKNCTALVVFHDLPILCSTEFVVFKVREGDARYLRYSFQSTMAVAALTALSSSATRSHARVDPQEIIKFKILRLPHTAQRSLADYLDRETARIDALVAEKERMLSLLEQKRTSLISSAVTRGLNPKAPTKPSGLDWLGEIPKHWKLERSKRYFIERDERSESGEEEMLTVSHITGVTPRSEKDVNMFEAESNEGYKLVSPDQLVINTLWAWMGAMGVAGHEGIVSPAYHVYRIAEGLLPTYVDLLVRIPAFKAEAIRFSKGVWSSRLRLYPEGLHQIWIPVPPITEQEAIIAHIQAHQTRTAALESALRDSIALLKERRATLITSAVTGRLDIATLSPK